MKLSFIIPLYNCADYIVRCLDSIYSSNNDDECFEVIVIDDGSNDNGPSLVSQYALNHNNLVIRSFANAGASEARNRGLDIAKGDYVWFVDADDKIHSAAIAQVFEVLLNNPSIDVLCFNHQELKLDGVVEIKNFTEDTLVGGLDYLNMHTTMYLWDKVYKRSAIGDTRFLKGIRNTEDWLFNIEVMLNVSRVQIKTFSGYVYNQTNINSTLSTATLSSLLKNSHDTMLVHDRLLTVLNNQKSEEKRMVLSSLLNFGVIGIFYAAFVDALPNEHIKQMISKYKQMGLYPVAPSYNKKANVFAKLLNKKCLFLLSVAIKRRIKHPKWM